MVHAVSCCCVESCRLTCLSSLLSNCGHFFPTRARRGGFLCAESGAPPRSAVCAARNPLRQSHHFFAC